MYHNDGFKYVFQYFVKYYLKNIYVSSSLFSAKESFSSSLTNISNKITSLTKSLSGYVPDVQIPAAFSRYPSSAICSFLYRHNISLFIYQHKTSLTESVSDAKQAKPICHLDCLTNLRRLGRTLCYCYCHSTVKNTLPVLIYISVSAVKLICGRFRLLESKEA